MARGKKKAAAQPDLLEVGGTTAPAVPLIREAVASWKAQGYRGISDTTTIRVATDKMTPSSMRKDRSL